MTSGIFLSGLPSALAQLLPGETLAEINIGEEGLQIGARYLFEPVELALPPIEPLFGGPPTEMGSIVVSAEHLRLHLNRELALSVELGLGLPESINKLAPSPWFETLSPSHRAPNLRLRLSVRGSDAELQLLDSPLKMLKLTPQRGSVPNAVLHLGRYGDIQFTLPVFRFDFVSKTLRAEGVFEYKDLCIPLSPIHALLRAAGKAELAQQLPEMLSVQPLDFGGIMRLVAGIIQSAIAKGPVGDKVRELLEDLFKNAEHMPERLRASFLNISPPRELGYQLSFGLDFSAHLSLFVSPAAPAPFRILLPLMGHRGPELIGITLYRLALGEILGGQLATLELDAEFERFEFLPIALSAGLSACGLFPPTSALEQRIVCRDLFAVMGNPGGIPIVMPLFFKHLGFCYTGLDGLSAEICLRFPRPELEFFTLARALRTIHGLGDIMAKRNGQGKTILEFPAELQTGLSVGPCYVRFPNYIGAQRLGTDTPIRIGDGTRLVSELTSILHTLDVDTLFAHLRSIDTLVQEEIELELGPALQQALRAWSDVVGPVILFVSGTPLYNSHNEVTEKPAGFSARIGMLRGRIAQGVKALRGHGEPLRVRARVVDISPEALHLIAVYSPAPKEPSREIPLTLRWERWLESAAELEDIVSAAPA